jgi:hypothetical protein
MNYWITTHWPVPESDDGFGRHVYVKDRHATVPAPGDVVFVRESRTVKGKLSPIVPRRHEGRSTPVKVPAGYGGIIGRMSVVAGKRRPVRASDVVYDYGDLPEWSVIDCTGYRPLRVPLETLLKSLGYPPAAGLMFLSLWRVPDEKVAGLLRLIGE